MEKLFVFAVCFVILSVFMVIPQRNSGALGQSDNRMRTDERSQIICNEHETSQQSCQNLARNSVHNISAQIRKELNASYVYMAMGAYFARDDVSYRGFAKFFYKSSDEEREHAQKFIDYLTERGGRVSFKTLHAPRKQTWETPLEALQDALELERNVTDSLLSLHHEAALKEDPHLQNFLESEFLTEQVESVKQLSDWLTVVRRLENEPLGLHWFDEELYQDKRT